MENQQDHGELMHALLECVLACENCAASCLQEDNVKMMARCITLDRDYADICAQAARLLQRKSPITKEYLQLCEKICRMCGDECAKHEMDHCQICAEACHRCADACSEVHV